MKNGTGKILRQPEWKRIGLGVGVGIVGLLTMTGLGAWLLEQEIVGLEWINYLAAVILGLSSFAGAKTAGAAPETWLNVLFAGIGMWLLLALIHFLGFGGQLKGMGATALAVLGGGGAAVLLRRGGRRNRRRAPKRRNW